MGPACVIFFLRGSLTFENKSYKVAKTSFALTANATFLTTLFVFSSPPVCKEVSVLINALLMDLDQKDMTKIFIYRGFQEN